MHESAISVRPLGDRAFTLHWLGQVAASDLAAKARAISQLSIPWLQETVAAYRSITFHIRDNEISQEQAAGDIFRVLDSIVEQRLPPSRLVQIPVVYGGEHGPDLTESARRSGLTEKRFVERHSEVSYVVAMMGFAPGFPYLSGLHETLAQPRHDTPRMKVLAGSVGIAGSQTGIYPVTSPGGWQIIGRTAIPLFRPDEEEPFLLAQGDRVKFVPVQEAGGFQNAAIETPAKTFDGPLDPGLTVLKPGLLTTIQDLGRRGWQAFGVSVGGAMDEESMRTANLLVGNGEEAAVMEMTLIGGSYHIGRNTLIAICGADLYATVEGERIPMNRPVYIRRGTVLSFGPAVSGCRAYLAIGGGIDVPCLLGSRSTDPRARMGGGFGRALMAGDSIGFLPPSRQTAAIQVMLRKKVMAGNARWSTVNWSAANWSTAGLDKELSNPTRLSRKSRVMILRLLPGAEWDHFSVESRNRLMGKVYRVEASSDRMGLRLWGEALNRENHEELESHGVVPGTIQVPPNGQPIILASGCQPTGGYPKIAHVISADLPRLAQAVPGDWLEFDLADNRTAWHALRERERELALLKAGMLAYARQLDTGGR